jgi:acetyl-CoA carboxylase biotin carboxyl carrier protein
MGLTDDDVREILRIIDESQLDELRIDMPGFKLHVRRGGVPAEPAADRAPAGEQGADAEPAAAAAVGEEPAPAEPAAEQPPAQAPEQPPAPTPSSRAPARASTNGATTIDAPMLGTFYRASAPGERPFVDVGSTVDPETVVCLIEVMKMMNSVKAGVAGTVVEVCATNAELVEYGEALFRVDPAT